MSDQRPPKAGRRTALRYLPPAVVFGLVALTGARSVAAGVPSLALSWMIAGLGGVAGSAIILAAALRSDHAVTHDRANPARFASVAWLARLLMLAAALATAIVGIALAPTGLDRGLAIIVSTGLAAALALFALTANDLTRQATRTPHAP
jgi:hypothetical protein